MCPSELISSQLVPWKSIGYGVVGQTKDGKDKKVLKEMYSEIVPKDLFDYTKPKLEAFICHNYFTQWQNQ